MTVRNLSGGGSGGGSGDAVENGLCVAGALSGCINSAAAVANHVLANRITVPKTGTLHDVAVWVGNQSGNIIAAVYDTGDALAGSRTRLWTSGSVAVGVANAWRVIGDPALAVTQGQQLDLTIMLDNPTATLLRWPNLGNVDAANIFPAGFLPAAGGASPKMSWDFLAPGFAAPAAITEAQCGALGASSLPAIIARVA